MHPHCEMASVRCVQPVVAPVVPGHAPVVPGRARMGNIRVLRTPQDDWPCTRSLHMCLSDKQFTGLPLPPRLFHSLQQLAYYFADTFYALRAPGASDYSFALLG